MNDPNSILPPSSDIRPEGFRLNNPAQRTAVEHMDSMGTAHEGVFEGRGVNAAWLIEPELGKDQDVAYFHQDRDTGEITAAVIDGMSTAGKAPNAGKIAASIARGVIHDTARAIASNNR